MIQSKGFASQSYLSNDVKKKNFDEEWGKSVERFKIIVGFSSLNLNLKHPKTGRLTKPHDALPEIFEQWLNIHTIWDRRSLMFEILCELIGQHMKPWQIANYFVADRKPFDALDVLQESNKVQIDQEDYASHCAALAKTLIALNYYEDALQWARRSVDVEPNNYRFQVTLADAYSLCSYCDEANAIYQERIATIPKTDSDSISQMFYDFFALETGAIPSPIFALRIAEQLSDPAQSAEFWQLAEVEFYDSPHFRMQHSYYLAKSGEVQRSFAKLLALVQEMPWLREASLNLMRFFDYFKKSGNEVMPDFKAELRQKIKEQGWTFEEIKELEINH